jgi:hypothetical protein
MNNLTVDELVVSVWEYYREKGDWNQPEADSALKSAQWYKDNHFPNLKISIVPRTVDYILKNYERNDDDIMFVDNTDLGFVKHSRAMHLNNSDVGAGVLANYHKVILDGHEKPVLQIKDGWWCMSYPDTFMPFSVNSPYESFFLSRDLPKLHLKQVHMMINWLESFPVSTVDEVADLLKQCGRGNLDNLFYYNWNMAVGRTMVRHWNSFDCVASGKQIGLVNGVFDRHTRNFHKLYGDSPEVQAAIRKWISITRNFINTYSTAFDQGNHATIWTKQYKLKPVTPGRDMPKFIL